MTKRELFNERAELDVLVAASLNRDALFKVLDMDELDFYFEKNRAIFRAMVELNREDVPVSLPTLFTKLKQMGTFDRYGGNGLLSDFTRVVLPHTVVYLIQDIQTKRKQREIIDATKDLYGAITKGTISAEDAGEKMIRLLNELNAPKEIECQSVKDMSARAFDSLFTAGTYTESRIGAIRKIIKFYDGQLITIAARPGQGKSSLALQFAEDMDDKVLFFALEMKAEHMYARMLSRHAQVEAHKIKSSNVSPEELARLFKVHARMASGNIVFYDKAHTISRIANIIRRECERVKPRAVFIDYLQLITGGEGDNLVSRIGYITRSLKLLAMQYEIPIFILSQLNRKVEETNREPNLSDLRDSGRIEEDSDVVIFLHGDKENQDEVKFIVGKNRDGDVGFKTLFFNRKYTFFQDIERQHLDGPTVPSMDYIHN